MFENLKQRYKAYPNAWGISLFFLFLVCLYFPLTYLLDLASNSLGINIRGIGPLEVFFFTIYRLKEAFLMLIVSYFILHKLEGKSMDYIFLGTKSSPIKFLFYGMGIGLLMISSVLLIEWIMGWVKFYGYAWQKINRGYPVILLKVFISSIAFVLLEEFLLRGILMRFLERIRGKNFAILLTSIFFTFLHIPGAFGTWAIYIAPFTLFLFGYLLAVLVYRYNSLWIAIGLHFAWNFFMYNIYTLTGTYNANSVFFITKIDGPQLWVGLPNSNFGPEAGLLGLFAFILALFFFWKNPNASDH